MESREDRLFDLIDSVYESVLHPAKAPIALDRLASFFGGVAAQLYTFDDSTGEVFDSQITNTLAAKDNEAYLTYYGRIDPRRQWLAETPVGTALRCSDRFDERYVAASEFYQDFMQPAGVRWVMGCRFEAGPGASSVLAAIRPTGSATFELGAVAGLARVASHFRRAALLRSRLTRAVERPSGVETLLHALAGPGLLLDGHGSVLLSNESGLAALAEIGAWLRGGRLRWVSAENQVAWVGCLERMRAGATSQAFDLMPNSSGWTASLLRMKVLGVSADQIEQHLMLVLFEHPVRPVARTLTSGSSDARGDPLTPAEAAVLAGLLAGRSAKQLARERAVAVSTVRSQIAAILSKTRAHSQRELMVRFARQ